jgi:hypothetical protein
MGIIPHLDARAMKVCAEKNCPVLTTRSYCDEHQAARDRARGTTKQRGYSGRHQSLRAGIVAAMGRGTTVRCIDCSVILTPKTLHLGHTDDRSGYRGPQCSTCNDRDGGRRSHLYR